MQPTMGAFSSFSSLVLGVLVLSFAIDAPSAVSGLGLPFDFGLNLPIYVKIRIEGLSRTIFEGRALTFGHNVTTASSAGSHHCDGSNKYANTMRGATATTALDDASRSIVGGFTWDATFSPEVDDFAITRIANDSQVADVADYFNWGLLVNSTGKYDFLNQPSGCQKRVNVTSEVLWAYNAILNIYFLKLDGPALASTNTPFVLTVMDGVTGKPLDKANFTVTDGVTGGAADGAVVQKATDMNGKAKVRVIVPGVYKFKAEREDSIRSNSITVNIVGL